MNKKAMEYLRKTNKTAKGLSAISVILNLLVVLGVLYFLLAPATALVLDIGKYEDGYNYYGWQLAIMGMGYPPVSILAMFEEASTIAGDLIPNQYDFTTNAVLLVAVVAPIVMIIISAIARGKVKNTGKAVCDVLSAIVLVVAAVIFIKVADISVLSATNDLSKQAFMDTYLNPAIAQGTYYTLLYPVLICGLCVIVALFKLYRASFLIRQKSYAKKYLNK